ncbi:hypothetical protein Tco_1430716 [Tanacetum coccineum]
MIVDIEDDIMDPVMQCITLPSHSSFSQKKLVSFVMEIHTLSIDISLQDCLDDGVAASFQCSQIRKPHAHTQAFKVNRSTSRPLILNFSTIKDVPSKGRYKTTPPYPNDIKSLIQVPRQGQVTRTKNKKTVVVDQNEILTQEIQTHMKPWVDIIHENAISLGGHMDHVSACLCHMLYCIETSTPYSLAFFILKRMEKTRNKPKELLPYGMLLTRLFKHVMSVSPELAIDHYISHDKVMHPLAPHYERKTRSDHCKKRPCDSNASSSSTTLNHPSPLMKMMKNSFILTLFILLKTSLPHPMFFL